MPTIEAAMRRSLREGFIDLLAASVRPALGRRQDLVSQANDVKTAFSSWDNCMAATYCKWPVIAIMIIGGLIIFSVVWCIIRCACCGLSCCCECCQCLRCCGNCCGCCDPPRGKRSKYLDEPYIPPNQGYKMQPPMNPHFPTVAPTMTPAVTGASTGVTAAAVSGPPQYAEFDVVKKGGEDALPAMPSWEDAGKKKILIEEEAVEMDQLKKPEAGGGASGQNGALMMGAAAAVPNPRSPVGSPGVNRSPYGPPTGAPGSSGYFPAPGRDLDPYGQSAQDYPQAGGAYGQPSAMGQDQGFGVAGAAVGTGRRSPYDNNGGYGDGPYGQGRGYGAPGRQDSIGGYGAGRQGGGSYGNYSAQQGNQGYGMGARRSPPNELAGDDGYNQANPGYGQTSGYGYGQEPARQSPAPQVGYGQSASYGQEPARRSPGPQAAYGGYDNDGYDARQYSTDSSRPLRSSPQRQYSRDAQPTTVQSDAGFDFGSSAYSRPGNYRQPSPVQQPQAGAYPGYKAYQPSNGQQGGAGGW